MNMNNKFTAMKSAAGFYTEFLLGSERVGVEESLLVYTDGGIIKFDGKVSSAEGQYLSDSPLAALKLTYKHVDEDYAFSERVLSVECKRELRIFKIEKILKFTVKFEEAIDYKTFRYASASAFIRFGKYGIFTGFANPYFKTCNTDENTVVQSFEPSLILNKGEKFAFDCDFIGMYVLSGELLYERVPLTPLGDRNSGYVTRYHNPSSLTPLDRCEIAQFSKFVNYWLSPSADKFIFEFYMYFSPVRPQPTQEDEQDYYKYIDNFKKLGGDLIVFQPLQRQTVPELSDGDFWEVYKEGSVGERILKYAKSKGLECGIYMGSAQENSAYCNSAMNTYADKSVKPEWKKVDANGTLSNENCMACDGFAEWFFNVQKNTIEKYGLGFWNWDPGPGNGHFCYNEAHGHLAGKGEYKGFRNASELIGKIKNLRGGIYLQAFHGVKEYGVWGLKYFDQHEAYWEQDPGFFATMYPDFSADRITADGMRLQAQWNMNFRFLPAVINHSLTNRMIQNCNNPESYLRELFDFYGYKYALMSALATGASITSPIVPFDSELPYVKEYFEFYGKWTDWARKNFGVLKNCTQFGGQVGEGIEGYAHIADGRGFIFLFNANPLCGNIEFTLNKDAELNGNGAYILKQIYPDEVNYFDESTLKYSFGGEDCINVKVEGYSVRLFEILPYKDEKLFGINGNYRISDTTLFIENAKMPYGSNTKLLFVGNGKIDNIKINGRNFNAGKHNGYVTADVLFGEKCDRQLTEWTLNGKPFKLFSSELKDGRIASNFLISSDAFIRKYGRSTVDYLSKIEEEKGNGGNMQLAWSVPDRIYFVIPFTDCDGVENLKLYVNRKECSLKRVTSWAITRDKTACFIGDITDYVIFGVGNLCEIAAERLPENTFSGAYLVYDSDVYTDEVHEGERTVECFQYPESGEPILRSDENGIKILSAEWVGGNFASHKEVTLCVKLNYNPDKVKRVFCSVPITIDGYSQLTMNTDRSLTYNPENGLWEVKLIIGDRRLLIIDDVASHIRAIDINNMVDDFVLPINWDFKID